MSQLQAFHSGAPLPTCLGASVYSHLHKEITNPVLHIALLTILRLSRAQYEFSMIVDPPPELMETAFQTQLDEIDWCTNVSFDDILTELSKEINNLQLLQDNITKFIFDKKLRTSQDAT